MIRFTDNLRTEVSQSLSVINAKDIDTLKKSEEITSLLNNAFNRLRNFIHEYQFKDEAEEIFFFKEIKPNLFCDLIYYRKVYNIEINRPTGGDVELKTYLEKELSRIKDFFDRNRAFYRYFRSGETCNDRQYYLRDKTDNILCQELFAFERDPKFSTCSDLKLAKIKANELLESFLTKELAEINIKQAKEGNSALPKEKLTWTTSKVFLIELVYALFLFGAFNYGKATLREIRSYIEDIFNIDLGANPSNSYSEMRERKERTPFLKKLCELLNNKMDEDDEK